MTVLVFGASSQVGHYLLPWLSARDEPVVALSRVPHAESVGVTWMTGGLPVAVPDVPSVSAIFSFGPLSLFALWLSRAELPHAPRIIVTSSMSAETKRVSDVPAERELSQSLRDSEELLATACARLGSDWTVLRPTLVYGAGMDKSLTPIARRAMRTRGCPLPAGRGVRQPVPAEDLARAALERSMTARQAAENFKDQVADQTAQVENLKGALRKLEQKLEETRSRCEMMIAQHRRARVVGKAHQARQAADQKQGAASMARMRARIVGREAVNAATGELLGGDSLEDRFAMLEREEQIEALLENLKQDLKKDLKQLEAPTA